MIVVPSMLFRFTDIAHQIFYDHTRLTLLWIFEVSSISRSEDNLIAWQFDKVKLWTFSVRGAGVSCNLMCLQVEKGNVSDPVPRMSQSFQPSPDYLRGIGGRHCVWSLVIELGHFSARKMTGVDWSYWVSHDNGAMGKIGSIHILKIPQSFQP